jgi:signal transduction histidine kinase
MDLPETIIDVLEQETAAGALRSLAHGLGLQRATWVAPRGEPGSAWPEGADPAEAATGADAVTLPVGEEGGAVVLSPASALDRAARERVAAAFARVVARERSARRAEEEREALRQRAEESEALHVLGLSANRSLDPAEVLGLVARVCRTLLGAHYVTVSTVEDEEVRTLAAVGLRGECGAEPDDLARDVLHAGTPLTLADAAAVEHYPVHCAEGMRAGLGVPLSLFGSTFGALVVGYRREYAATPRDLRLALTLAGHAAVALSNARLHHALADRSRELERAYEELRWSTEAKERFFASLSHELRTPLNGVLGYHSLLLEGVGGELPARALVYVQNAQRATRSLLVLVNDVLDLAKIEAGKVELAVRSVPVDALLRDALATIRPLAARGEIRLSAPDPLPDVPLTTDPDRVGQILLNLLSNAVKFTEAGEVALSVEVGSGEIEFRVRDTGPGIDAEDHERIFHEFEQITGSSSRDGTGLGLPISRKLARLLGGELRVESAPGEGSTFVLRLPLRHGARSGTSVAGEADRG